MRPNILIGLPAALVFLDVCTAKGLWTIEGCDRYDQRGIRASVIDAFVIAETAVRVLKDHPGDDKVQSMAKFILGDGSDFQPKLDKAKGYLENVASNEKVEETFLANPGYAKNTDMIIYCDNSNLEDEPNGLLLNKMANMIVVDANDPGGLRDCYSQTNPPTIQSVATAITTTSDGTHPNYPQILQAWYNGGKNGPKPDNKQYITEQKGFPSTVNLCTWFLNAIGKPNFARIDDTTITRAQAKDFLKDFSEGRPPIDALSSTLAGTLLHEFSHTVNGGRSDDIVAAGGCYGWDCVGNLQNADNADSISLLGISMYLFSKGYWVDDDGSIKNI